MHKLLPLLAAAVVLAGCVPARQHASSPAASGQAASDSTPQATAATTPGATTDILLKAGFQVPKSDVSAEDFTLKSLDGKSVRLSSFKGSFVFLSFWATWCGPCKQELPSVEAMYEKLKARGLTVLAVDVMEDNKLVRDFVKTNAMTFPVLLDSEGKVGSQYDAGSIPTNYLIGRDGRILARVVGYDGVEWTSASRLALFDTLLAQ
jgi:peroxiredoxin